jgi:hypothetical protein
LPSNQTPTNDMEGTRAGLNDRNYNTDELRKEVDREVAHIKSFIINDNDDKNVDLDRINIETSPQK